MKNFVSKILLIIILIALPANSFAKTVSKSVPSGKETGNLMGVDHVRKNSYEEVLILLDKYAEYRVLRLSSPDRLVIDVENTKAPYGQKIVNVNGKLVKKIRYAQFEDGYARIVLDVEGQPEYKILPKNNEFIVYIGDISSINEDELKRENESEREEESDISNRGGEGRMERLPDIKLAEKGNIYYYNNSDRVYFRIPGAKLTEGSLYLNKLYTEEYDSTGKKYTITFPSDLAKLEEGAFGINDSMLHSIEISKDEKNASTSITFNAKDSFSYLVFTRADSKDTAITVLKPAAPGEKIVVIDPGHGGIMPGAIYKDKNGKELIEKNLNLDIASRLKILLKNKKIKTYMIREDDSHVDNYERTYIANMLGASLYLSIHNNAMTNTSIGGTMTLCYPRSVRGKSAFDGKDFAQMIQKELLKKLKTTDRKVIDRPDLIVLKTTAMPAALAEVAFITNDADRKNLQTVAFRRKAAEALRTAVVNALKEIEKYER